MWGAAAAQVGVGCQDMGFVCNFVHWVQLNRCLDAAMESVPWQGWQGVQVLAVVGWTLYQTSTGAGVQHQGGALAIH